MNGTRKNMRQERPYGIVLLCLLFFFAARVHAQSSYTLIQTTEEDFQKGTFNSTYATGEGDVLLDRVPGYVRSLAVDSDNVYVGMFVK